jgi:hypothetical protein
MNRMRGAAVMRRARRGTGSHVGLPLRDLCGVRGSSRADGTGAMNRAPTRTGSAIGGGARREGGRDESRPYPGRSDPWKSPPSPSGLGEGGRGGEGLT